MSFESQYATSY